MFDFIEEDKKINIAPKYLNQLETQTDFLRAQWMVEIGCFWGRILARDFPLEWL